MKKLGFHPATVRRVSYALSSPTHSFRHAPNAQSFHLCSERAQVGAGQSGIAVALEDEGAGPLRSILLALTEDVGLDPEPATETDEGRVGQRQLLVRCRREGPVAVLLEEDGAGSEIESDSSRPCWSDVGDAERLGEPALKL